MDEQIALGDSVAELYHFKIEAIHADALVAILAVDQRLAMLKLHDVLAARVLFCDRIPRVIVKDVAVLQDLNVRRAFVCRRLAQGLFQVLLEDINRARDKCGPGSDRKRKRIEAADPALPNGVDLVFLPISDVGENLSLRQPINDVTVEPQDCQRNLRCGAAWRLVMIPANRERDRRRRSQLTTTRSGPCNFQARSRQRAHASVNGMKTECIHT